MKGTCIRNAAKGFVGTTGAVFCTFVLAFTFYGTWTYWEKPFNRHAGKFDGQGIYSENLSGRVSSCTVPGAVYGLCAGVLAGFGVALLRLSKTDSPTT